MRNTVKFLLFLIVWAVFWVLFINLANAQEKNLQNLFQEMGVTYQGMQPCHQLGNQTRKYCAPHDIRNLLSAEFLSSQEAKVLIAFLKSEDPCELVAQYIERICKQENFKKIMKHFAEGTLSYTKKLEKRKEMGSDGEYFH